MNDKELMAILACPICDDRPHVRLQGELLVCEKCGRGYKIIDGIPRMLPEDAIPPEEVGRLKNGS